MEVPFTWRPTGWFQIGWSADFPLGEVTPLRYFGEDLVAYRGESGELHVLDAHCPHLGAHIGHHGKVTGECVTCPYHGWEWSPEGVNVSIPYQDAPNRSKRLRSWETDEQYGSVYLWHHPHGEPSSWPMADIFTSFPQFETDPSAYYEPITAKAEREPVHPQVVAENGPDSVHFAYVHRATVTPVALDWEPDGPLWKFLTGWPNTRSDDPDEMILRIHSWMVGLGGSVTAFEGANYYRPERETMRDRLNDWIRRAGIVDAVFEMDKVVADPASADRLRGDLQVGDNLHPNAAGQRAMGEAIPLSLFD